MPRPWILFLALIAASALAPGQSLPNAPERSSSEQAANWASLPAEARASISHALALDAPALKTSKLTASDGKAFDTLGWNVAISGNTIAVGAPGATIGSNSAQGAIYVFEKPASGWKNMTQTAKLTASDGQTLSLLGRGVAISGNTIVAGAPGQFTNQFGEAYVYVEPKTGWANMTETAILTPSDAVEGDEFGYSVGISGGTIVVGALGAQNLAGAAYVYVKPARGWSTMNQTAELSTSDGAFGSEFASTVAISGNTIVGGEFLNNGSDGAVYVFVKPASGWADAVQTAKLTPSENLPEAVGFSVAISGNTIAAGAFAWPGNETFEGAVYVFVEPSGGWTNMTQTAILTASDASSQSQLGYSVGISGNLIVGGAEGWPDGAYDGALYVYQKPAGGWVDKTETAKVAPNNGSQELGYAAAANGSVFVGGAPDASVNSQSDQGEVYVITE